MENPLRAGALALSAVLLIAAPAAAQPPLIEVARAEAARRASISEKSEFYTNDDLTGGPRLTTGAAPRPEPEAAAEPGASAGSAAAAEADEAADGARDEAWWRGRITAAREARRQAELLAAALQNRVDGLLAELAARDDPFQRAGLERDRADALAELQRMQDEVARLTDEIAAIREEARRAGAPPGWLR